MHWNNILNTFLQLLEKTAFLKQLLNNKVSDFIEGPQSFITMIDISSCPWVLLNPVLILVFSSNQYQHCLLNWKFKSLNWWECAIVFGIGLQCLLEKWLKIFALSWKLLISLLLTSLAVLTRVFIPLRRVMVIGQYAFGDIVGSLSLLARRS